jgi:hypothetical protein
MVIARMLVRGGLLTLAFTSAIATATAICRIMRAPSLRDATSENAIRASTEPIRFEVEAPVLRASPCVNRQNLLWRRSNPDSPRI